MVDERKDLKEVSLAVKLKLQNKKVEGLGHNF